MLDRVVQQAVKLLLEPIFEADFTDNAYGYRAKRSAQDALEEVQKELRSGHTDVVDADLSKYFDTIPHAELMKSVARRVHKGPTVGTTTDMRTRCGLPAGDLSADTPTARPTIWVMPRWKTS